jgi:5-methylcytosine-specific restriction endonuclease McrA
MNPEKRRETTKKYREKNPEACKEAYLKWQEKEKARGWAVKKAYDLANPEQRKARALKWAKNNPEYMKMLKHRRRGAPGTFTKKDIDFLMKSQRGKCVSCFISLIGGKHIDHITPIARGGTNHPANIQLLCPDCNRRKGAKDPIDFMQERGFLL